MQSYKCTFNMKVENKMNGGEYITVTPYYQRAHQQNNVALHFAYEHVVSLAVMGICSCDCFICLDWIVCFDQLNE